MFTGIVARTAVIKGTSEKLGIKRVLVEKIPTEILKVGQSVSINGVCSTIVEISEGSFAVEYMPETLKKTCLKSIVADQMVNLEHSIKAGDPMDGHFVYGHVDCIGCLSKIKNDGPARHGSEPKATAGGESRIFSISIPKEFHKYIAYKGSVAVDGVSLTVSDVSKNSFEVSLIPYTLEHTTLGGKKVGDMMNIETDIIARYLERLGQSSKIKDQN